MSGELLLDAYPLTWPERQPRTAPARRRIAKFQAGLAQARDELLAELGRLGARQIVVSTNVPVRRDGLPSATAHEPGDPGVAVYFERRPSMAEPGKWVPFVIACDSYRLVKWNLRAVGATVEALRAIERHGSTAMLEQAFKGFAALPPGPSSVGRPWWVILEVAQDADEAAVVASFRALSLRWHPDRPGGDVVRMAEINAAYHWWKNR